MGHLIKTAALTHGRNINIACAVLGAAVCALTLWQRHPYAAIVPAFTAGGNIATAVHIHILRRMARINDDLLAVVDNERTYDRIKDQHRP